MPLELDAVAARRCRACSRCEVFDWVDANSKIVYEPIYGRRQPIRRPRAGRGSAAGCRTTLVGTCRFASRRAQCRQAGRESGSLRVATEKIDALINLVGELVITQSMLCRFSEKYEPDDVESLRRSIAQLTRNTRELQESVMQYACCHRFLVQPLSALGARFVTQAGQESRAQVERREHGTGQDSAGENRRPVGAPRAQRPRSRLESPEQRLAAGKKPKPEYWNSMRFTRAAASSSRLRTDGAGLKKDRILAKARERGLVESDALLSDEQIYNLIFVAGLLDRGYRQRCIGPRRWDGRRQAQHQRSGRPCSNIQRPRSGQHHSYSVALDSGHSPTVRFLRVGKEIYIASLVSIIETVQSARENLSCVAAAQNSSNTRRLLAHHQTP